MKRGTNSVLISSIVVVIVSTVRVEIVGIVSIVVVAGTQPALMQSAALKVYGKSRTLSVVSFRRPYPAVQKLSRFQKLLCDYFGLFNGYRLFFSGNLGVKIQKL